jgi:GAF domain-containing protein
VPNADHPRNQRAVQALDQLVGMSLREHSADSLLQAVADLSKQVMPGGTEVSVTLTDGRRKATVASTGELALDLDEVQYAQDQGPCLHAAATGELTEVPDTRTETRWAAYMTRAVGHGALSSLSVPLAIDGDVFGALNIYARRADAFDDDARAAAVGFAPYAAVALRDMHDYQGARDLARDLEATMETRSLIDHARGVLMERLDLTADQALEVLSDVSDRTGSKLREVAATLLDTGEMPGPDRR